MPIVDFKPLQLLISKVERAPTVGALKHMLQEYIEPTTRSSMLYKIPDVPSHVTEHVKGTISLFEQAGQRIQNAVRPVLNSCHDKALAAEHGIEYVGTRSHFKVPDSYIAKATPEIHEGVQMLREACDKVHYFEEHLAPTHVYRGDHGGVGRFRSDLNPRTVNAKRDELERLIKEAGFTLPEKAVVPAETWAGGLKSTGEAIGIAKPAPQPTATWVAAVKTGEAAASAPAGHVDTLADLLHKHRETIGNADHPDKLKELAAKLLEALGKGETPPLPPRP